MSQVKLLILFACVFLISCSGEHRPEYIGDYYLYYKDGKVLLQSDSANQIYIRMHGDHTFKLKYFGGIESGKWKTIDHGDFWTTYFYNTYLDCFFSTNAIGETFMGYASQESKTRVFIASHWYGKSKLGDYLYHHIVICEQNKTLSKEELKDVLIRSYGR